MKKAVLIGLALCLAGTANAQWGRKIKGNGNMVTMERSTGEYDAVSVSGSFDVDLVAGTEGNVKVRAEENLQEWIVTEVKDGELIIKVKNGVNLRPSSWKDGFQITVPVETINAISLAGSGNISGKTTLSADEFTTKLSGSGDMSLEVESNGLNASMSGSGDINLRGHANRFYVQISGSGDVDAYELEAEEVDANISGSADILVNVTQLLKARVSGSGDIHYRGNPAKIDSKVSGSGSISKG